jgi:hypothetical protein
VERDLTVQLLAFVFTLQQRNNRFLRNIEHIDPIVLMEREDLNYDY